MGEDKIIQIKEEPMKVETEIKSTTTEVNEASQDVEVQVPTPPSFSVEDANIIDIEMDEAFPYMPRNNVEDLIGSNNILIDGQEVNGSNTNGSVSLVQILTEYANNSSGEGTTNHSLLDGRELPNQHPISAISNLKEELDEIKSLKRVYSSENGFGEFRKWDDENPKWEDRSGYFVKLIGGTENVAICTNQDDVYGVSVIHSGFVGGQDISDKSDDPLYALVGITGALRVRTDGTATTGDYIVPNELGVATKSKNNCGYKVISTGSYASYEYLTIAVTPQNDKINKIYGTLMDAEGSFGNIVVRLGEVESRVDNATDRINIAINNNDELKNLIKENTKNIESVGATAQEAQKAANQATEKANQAVTEANNAKNEALAAANEAKDRVNASLADINDLKDKMTIISSFNDGDGNTGVQGFVDVAEKNNMLLGSLQESVNEYGTDITSISQQIKETEAAIQHLVVHSDKYSVGEYSLSYGLSYDEAKSLLKNGDMYIATFTHTETMKQTIENPDDPDNPTVTTTDFSFERGYAYQWDATNMMWVKGESVSTATTYSQGTNVGDLWFCWQEVEYTDESGNTRTLIPGTLYRWSEDGQWVAIATTDGNYKSRMISSIKQTADGIYSDVANLRGDVSTISQEVDKISTRVATAEGNISNVEQRADSIEAEVNNINGTMTSIKQQADDNSAKITSVASGQFSMRYQSFMGNPELVVEQHKYNAPPFWDEDKQEFAFSDEIIDDTNGIYCYATKKDVDGNTILDKTKYYKITSDGYEVYIVGNQATSFIDQRIDENEAAIDLLVQYKDGELKESLANIGEKADANGASINYMTSYYYHTLLSVSETPAFSPDGLRYKNKPSWNPALGKYEFDAKDKDENGAYYIADEDATTYCCIKTAGDGTTLYEIYGLAGSYMAAIQQGADENGGYIQSIVLDIEAYNVGQYSPSYGMSYDDAVTSIPKGTMYVPVINHSENLIPDERASTDTIDNDLDAGTLSERESSNDVVRLPTPPFNSLEATGMQTYDFVVENGQTYSYKWTGTAWEQDGIVSLSKEYFAYDGTKNIARLWYCTQDVTSSQETENGKSKIYKQGTLYAWHGGRWFAIATVNDNLLSRSISLVRQTANSYSIELRNMQGDFSQYKQTVNNIGLLVSGSDGSSGELNISKEGIVGEVYNRTGNSGTLKTQVDSTQAVLDLMVSGLYHKLEQPLTSNVPQPYGTWGKYAVRPEWSVALKKFVFDTRNEDADGIYYFFDNDETHYCKVVGDQYEVYTIGKLSTAGTDAHITEEYANINTLAYFGDDEQGTIAGLRNLALEGKAQVQLLASLDKNKLNRVVDMYGYTVPEGTKRYANKPTYLNGAFTFSGQVEDTNGEYFLINSQQFGKLILGNKGSCYGYEVYDYDSSSTAGLVSTVLDNQANVGMIVDSNGVRGSVVVEAINGQSQATISADKVNLNGYVTINSLKFGGSTEIDGSRIVTGVIDSSNYSYSSGNFSTSGTSFDLSDGSIISKNVAIDADGNVYLRKNINIGLNSNGGYNFTVDSFGNVNVAGTLDAKVLKFNGKSVLTSDDKVKADYLELKGIIVTDSSNNITFKVDSNGNVTVNGNITMGSGSSISWNSITGVPSTVTGAYSLADSAYDKARDAQADASNALDAAGSANSIINGWKYTYKNKTYIDGTQLMTGTVTASTLQGGSIKLLDSNANTCGELTLTSAQTAAYAVDLTSDGALRFKANDGSLYLETATTFIQLHGSPAQITILGAFIPSKDNYMELGDEDHRWIGVYSVNCYITNCNCKSDKKQKNSIEYNLEKYEDFFFKLKPTQFKFNEGTGDRYHTGFISQDVGDAIVESGLSTQDFAAFVKAPKENFTLDADDQDCDYYLRYNEFIALNTHMIQKLYTKIDELENKIQQLEKTSTEME
jgi:hypothetical protein